MSPSQLHQFRLDTSGLDGASFAAKYGIDPGYMTDTNRYFERIGHVPGKWNRAVFYDGGILHSGNIQWDGALPQRQRPPDGECLLQASQRDGLMASALAQA